MFVSISLYLLWAKGGEWEVAVAFSNLEICPTDKHNYHEEVDKYHSTTVHLMRKRRTHQINNTSDHGQRQIATLLSIEKVAGDKSYCR